MKKTFLTALALGLMHFSFTAFAQDQKEQPEKKERKEQQEITIRSTGDTTVSLTVQINGDNVTINGKPLVEFKDDGVTINKRKFTYKDGHGNMSFNIDGLEGLENMNQAFELQGLQFDKMGKQFELKSKQFQNLNKDFLNKPFLGVTTEKTSDGAKIVEISKGSAAEKAGLKVNDIITKIDKETVTDADVLANIISTKKPKDEIKVYYKREGKNKDVKAVLTGRPAGKTIHFNYNGPNPDVKVRTFKSPRININPDMQGGLNNDNFVFDRDNYLADVFPRQKKLGLKIQDTEEGGNVKIIEVADSSAAQKAGLKKDDLITEIDGQKVDNTDDAREQLQEVADKAAYQIKAKRNGTEMSFDVKIPKKLKTANL